MKNSGDLIVRANAQPIGDVTVLVGRHELSVDVSGPENDLEAAQDLGETAIGRMP